MFNNVNVAATYLSRDDLPTITVGMSVYDNDNGLSVDGPRQSLRHQRRDAAPVHAEFVRIRAGARHTASLSLSTSNRDDKSIAQVRREECHRGTRTDDAVPDPAAHDLLGRRCSSTRFPCPVCAGSRRDLNYGVLYASPHGTASIAEPPDGVGTRSHRRSATITGSRSTPGLEWTARPDMQLLFQFSFFKNCGCPEREHRESAVPVHHLRMSMRQARCGSHPDNGAG